MEKPSSVTLRGITIDSLSGFRYDPVHNEHQFFELTFNADLLNTQPQLNLDAPEGYSNTPVVLNFPTQSGKTKRITANIIILKQIRKAGQEPTVSIAGTFYSPGGKFPKLNRFLLSAALLPLLLIGTVCLYINHLNHKLVQQQGVVRAYENTSSYKGYKTYTFHITPYQATFKRSYHRPILNTAPKNIDALFMSSYDGYHADSTGQAVRFFVLSDDTARLSAKDQTVAFFNLQYTNNSFSGFDLFLDVLHYNKSQVWHYFVWAIYAFLEICCIGFAFYYYRMFAFHRERKKRIAFGCYALLLTVLNLAVFFLLV